MEQPTSYCNDRLNCVPALLLPKPVTCDPGGADPRLRYLPETIRLHPGTGDHRRPKRRPSCGRIVSVPSSLRFLLGTPMNFSNRSSLTF